MFLKRLNKIKETNKIAVLLLIFSFLASQFLYTVPISVFAAENASPDLGQNPICNPNINLVKNGSFEKPAIGGSWNIFSSVPNWSVDWIGGPNSFGNITRPTKGLLEIQKNVNNWLPSKGEQYAELDTDWDGPNGTNDGEPSSVVIWQNLETISGGTYKLSVDFSPRPDTPKEDNILGILWGGVAVSNTPITASGKNISNTVWTTHTFNLLANSNNTELRFSDLGKQNSLGTFIDNISVTCVPKATPPPSPTNTPPTITLLGDNPLEWNLNELFVDPGATAKDLEDGDATTTENIIVTGTVNASTTGSYILTYSVTDSGGLSASTTREVKVVDNSVPPVTPPVNPYASYCGDGVVNQEWEQCDNGGVNDTSCTSQCQYPDTNQCSDLTLAKVTMKGVENWNGGDLASDIYLGSSSNKIPANTWFAVYYNGSYITDRDISSYEDVKGLAVQRLKGSIRTVLHGSHSKASGGKEHVYGTVEVLGDNANVFDVISDNSGNNKLENGKNGSKNKSPNNDEIWLVNNEPNRSHYWMTVDVADDGFYTKYSIDTKDLVCEISTIDLDISKATSVSTTTVNTSFNYTITLTNNGPKTAKGVTVKDILPNGIIFEDASSTTGLYATSTGIWTIGDMTASSTDTLDLTVSASATGTFINTATATSSGLFVDSNSNNDSDIATVVIKNKTSENTPPTITLLGDNPLEWNLNELFVDPGATAKDLEDGDATTTENIIVTGTVNASTTGSYILTYSVTDSGGLSASTTREVKVVDNATPPIVPPILPPGGGGGGGGGLGGHRHSVVTGEVLGATTCSYLKDYLKIDRQNDPIEVLKLQSFLNVFEGENLSLTGVFNQATLGAVERFQVKYSKDILKPWGKNVTTGYVYILTKKKINEIYCNSVINLSQNDKNEITAFKAFGENNPNVVINNPAVGFLSTPDNSLNVLNSNSSSSPTVTLKDNSSTTVANNNSALKNIAVSILAFPKKIFSGGGYTFTFLLLILVAVIIALIKLFAGPKHSNNVPITPIAETNDDKKTESPVIILPGVLPDEEIVVENPEEEPDEVIIDTPDLRSTDKKDKN